MDDEGGLLGDFRIDADGSVTEIRGYLPGVAVKDWQSGKHFYFHHDHGGSTRVITDETGAVLETHVYTAFGERISESDPEPATSYGWNGLWGYDQGQGNGFDFLRVGHRWYDRSSGRFLQRDPVGLAGGLNPYSYVQNDPLSMVDPLGLSGWGNGPLSPPPGNWPSWDQPRNPRIHPYPKLKNPPHSFRPKPSPPSFNRWDRLRRWARPTFRFTPVVLGKCVAAAAAGYALGTAINHAPRLVGGDKLSDYIGDAMYSACPWCFDWSVDARDAVREMIRRIEESLYAYQPGRRAGAEELWGT